MPTVGGLWPASRLRMLALCCPDWSKEECQPKYVVITSCRGVCITKCVGCPTFFHCMGS